MLIKYMTVFSLIVSLAVFVVYGGFPSVIAILISFTAHFVNDIFSFGNQYLKRIEVIEKKLSEINTHNSLRNL